MNLTEIGIFSLLHVATRGDTKKAARAITERLAVEVGDGPGRVATRSDGLLVLWFGPGRWLVHAPKNNFRLDPFDGCALTELTDSRRIFRLSGRDACDFLSAPSPLNLSEDALPTGTCAWTQFDRFSVLLHRLSSNSFDLYVERSYASALMP